MKTENIFEFAVRNKLRFAFKGNLSVEDLWDLKVEELDSIFKNLNSQVKQSQEESLLTTKSKADAELEVKIAIVKYIVKTKLEEKEAKAKAFENRAKKQKIMEIMATREDEALHNMSDEDLKKMLAELGE